ncbi:LmeA family phospholipid-binding protein [Streptomyces sp. SDT5-1]|uniref:LmeA family phospholipid-binding protein n=1 Tax=Streptomyces sp. SDT5-1 TaxID=3406418 RepID=UPI003FD25CF7
MRTPHRISNDRTLYDDWAEESVPPPPPPRSRRRRRRSLVPGLVKGLIAVLVLCGFLALADRWAVLYAENKAAQQIKKQLKLAAAPEVEIPGFPFLTQVADRRIHELRVTVPDVAADRVTLAKVSATAHNVRIKGSGLTDISGAYADAMNGQVLLSFADMNRELGASQVTFTGHGDNKVLARGTLPVAGHDVKVRADAHIQRLGASGISTDIDNMSLAIGDLATYRPGTRASEGLHLTRATVERLTKQADKVRQLLAVPAVVQRLGVPDSVVRQALASDAKLRELTGSPRFVQQLMGTNLIDIALAHPAVLKRLGLDPALLDGLTRLTRPELADRLSLAFRLPQLPGDAGYVRLRDVTVEKEGIRVDLSGGGLSVGG